jgi:hypothetical protein
VQHPPNCPNVVILQFCQAILAILTTCSSGKKICNSAKYCNFDKFTKITEKLNKFQYVNEKWYVWKCFSPPARLPPHLFGQAKQPSHKLRPWAPMTSFIKWEKCCFTIYCALLHIDVYSWLSQDILRAFVTLGTPLELGSKAKCPLPPPTWWPCL